MPTENGSASHAGGGGLGGSEATITSSGGTLVSTGGGTSNSMPGRRREPDPVRCPSAAGRTLHPTVVVLLCTLLCTSCATGMLCAAICTEHWEYVHWNRSHLGEIAAARQHAAAAKGLQLSVESYLDGLVTKVIIRNFAKPRPLHKTEADQWLLAHGIVAGGGGYREPLSVVSTVFLVPTHGGIWTMCVYLTEEQMSLLENVGFIRNRCTNYLYPEFDIMREEDAKADWQHRMQNLSISCALVCLIILGSSALVGAFGVLKHQISAVLVTGVMYLLAAFFALFTLTIIHFKRAQTRHKPINFANCIGRSPEGEEVLLVDGVVQGMSSASTFEFYPLWIDFYKARLFSVGWSLDLAWGGVTLCVLTSIFWILLSKMMRYNPITSVQSQSAGGGGGGGGGGQS